MKFKNKVRPPKKHKRRAPIGSRSDERLKNLYDRKAERYSELGRQTEDRVSGILAMKQEQGEIISFVKHPAHGPEDLAGKDFTVSMGVGEKIITVSFGVTISNRQELDVPLIMIPHNMTDERIWHRICQICKKQTSNS